jgi:anti-sigma factor RsiW
MSGRGQHISTDRLTALAFVARAPQDGSPDSAEEARALAHVAGCDACSTRLAELTASADELRDAAFVQADAVFDDAMLDAQRTRILDRLAHLGQSARVLSFPHRSRDAAMPVSSTGRRWISVAAAAGLIIGLVAGQMLHFVPFPSPLPARDDAPSLQADRAPVLIVPASASLPAMSDDELMEEVEAAVQLRRAQSLRAIDALTPTAADLLALGR